jgi:uncharacterized protein
MSQFDASEFITQLFLRLRRQEYRFRLGVGEYQAALQSVEQGFGQDGEAVLELVQVLWCSSREQQERVKRAWQQTQTELQQDKKLRRDDSDLDMGQDSKTDRKDSLPTDPGKNLPLLSKAIDLPAGDMSSVPVQAPLVAIDEEDLLQLRSYYPVSRRAMSYGWRMLRRIVADGARTVLDLPGTIASVTQQGYYLGPVYQRRRRNDARLILLVDQNGSMMPFHRFTRDLVETAQQESQLPLENVQVFYFHNVPGDSLYRDLYLTEPVEFGDMLAACDDCTSVLVVSDAGAARGRRRQERIQATTSFLRKLRRRTSLIAWLNPMSERRWEGSSAEILAYLVPMFQMDRAGFADAVSAMRGLLSQGGGV